VEDRWILSEFADTMIRVETAWTGLDIYTATQALKTFGTGILPSHWLEMSKSRLYDGDANAAWTIHRIVRDLMSALSPVCPFFTHHISSTLYEQSAVDVREFPTRTPDDELLRELTNAIEEFNGSTWRQKKDSGLSLNAPISGIAIPDELSEFTSILTQMHKLE
jgi:valyl-tRNA synthetase